VIGEGGGRAAGCRCCTGAMAGGCAVTSLPRPPPMRRKHQAETDREPQRCVRRARRRFEFLSPLAVRTEQVVGTPFRSSKEKDSDEEKGC